jgi:hypothetical protein
MPDPRRLLAAALLAATASATAAEADTARFDFAADRYLAGNDIAIGAPVDGDLFAASEDLAVEAAVAGTAHLAARTISLKAPIGTLYAFAYRIDLDAEVTGPALMAAAEIRTEAGIGGNLRLFAREAEIGGALGASALIAAQDLRLDAPVAGDLMLAVEEVEFGEAARVAGRVVVYTEEGRTPVEIPASVAPPERVELRSLEARDDIPGGFAEVRRTAGRAAVAGFVLSVLTVAALAAAAIAIAPDQVARWRAQALDRPGPSLVAGFLVLSTTVGAGFVLALTIIGIPFLLAALLLAGLMGYAGYVMGAYILGVGLWLRLGRAMPGDVLPKAGLALLGAFVAGLVALIPLLGWLVVLALALTGLGAIASEIREARRTGDGA